ncbi:MAG: collagen-like protein [Lachnospiraceae bacterium]|nr:collagen-like protein [Lachnospiraceae bacterium]
MKNKLVMIVLSVILVLAAGAMVYAIYSTQSGKEVFAEDGYIIVYDESDTEQPAKTYHFTEGTAFKRSYEGSIQFRDTEGNTVTADANSFVHYDSGASASLSKSVLVNLDEVGSSAVNYYGMGADTSVDRSGSSYSIASQGGNIDLSNYLWKVGNNRYMMVSDVITVSFSDGNEYQFDDYVELIYQEGGMVTIINGDTMLRDASKNTYVSTDTGISINLATQVILEDGAVRMSLGSITTDSEQVVNVLPADVPELKIIIPEFNFTVIDGKNGEAGADGENGRDGVDGDVGADGLNGEGGRTGLMGYDGDDGVAGQAGTSGRSGVNGVEGAEGIDGASGNAGAPGTQGGQGAAGSAGSAGGAGATGPSGSDGNQGNAGDAGAHGNSVTVANPTDVLKDVPMIYWERGPVATYSEITGSFGFKMSVDAAAAANIKNVKITLIDMSTGKVVKVQEVNGEISAGENSTKTELSGLDKLTPATAYRMQVSGSYDYLDSWVDTVFDDRTLVTDDFPLNINVYGVEDHRIDLELVNRDADADPTTTVVTRVFTVAYKLEDQNGTVVAHSDDFRVSNNVGAGANPTIINDDGTTSDHLIINQIEGSADPLHSDTTYYFTVVSLSDTSGTITDIPARYVRIPVKTLKRVPQISNVEVVKNILNQSFDLSVATVNDPDHAITRFRYEIIDSNGEIKKTVYAPNSDIVHCYVDGSELTANEYYRIRAVAEAFDNRKNIEAICDFPDQVTLDGVTQYSWFTLDNKDKSLVPNALGTSAAGGEQAKMSLHIPARAKLKDGSDVKIVYHSNAVESGYKEFTWQSGWNEISAANGTGLQDERIYPLQTIFSDLKSSTTYKFDAYGTVDMTGDGTYTYSLLGSFVITTPKYQQVGGTSSGGTNGAAPIYFTLSLSGSSVGSGPNTTQYAVNQAGSTSTVNDETFRGSVHVQLYTPSTEDTTKYVLVCEGDIPLKMEGNNGTDAIPDTTNNHITLDNFPGNPKVTSFNGKYKAKITEAYDSTSHKNVIPVSIADVEKDIGKTYPDPDSLSLSVVPITKDNYNIKTGQSLPTKYNNYDPTTVIGFELTPVGIESTLSYFDYIEYYAYDAKYYAENMVGIVNTLQSSNPPSGTTLSRVSSNGESEQAGTAYFYPMSDPHYMAKMKIELQDTASHTNTMSGQPRGLFLFDDFAYAKASTDVENEKCCNGEIVKTNEFIHNGYTITADVREGTGGNAAVNSQFFRGRDYEFTFRLHSNQTAMGESKYYPEVLGDDKAVVFKSTTTLAAPYEEPSYYFYPADSGISSLTYGYYIKTVDATQIFAGKQMTTTKGTLTINSKANTSWVSTIDAATHINQDGLINISGLNKNEYVSVQFSENLYLDLYSRSKTLTAFSRLFTSKTDTPVGSFSATEDDTYSRVKFNIRFNTTDMAKSVAAIEGTFRKLNDQGNAVGEERKAILDISSVTGTDIVAYVPYSELSSIADNEDTVSVYLTVYYDSGIEGFLQTEAAYGSEVGTAKLVCVREAGETSAGQYLTPLGETGSDFENRKLASNEIRAEGSIFKLTRNSTGEGAQLQNIAGTLVGENAKPGLINIQLRNWKDKAWYYDTSANSRARLGGAYDARITKTLLPYTVSLIKTETNIKGPDGSSTADTFTLGAVIPQVNLHTKTGYTISAGVNDANVKFEITGVKGVANSIYGYDTGNSKYGNVYLLLYEIVNQTYKPVLSGGNIRRIKKELNDNTTTGAPGDGIYSVPIDNLQPNRQYAVQLVYYKTLDDYNKDTGNNGAGDPSKRVYLPDALYPDTAASTIYYPINTTTTIQLVSNETAVVYSAKGYYDKSLEVSYHLATSSPNLKPEEKFIYALYDSAGNLILTHKELEGYLEEGYGTSIKLDVSPNTLKIGKNGVNDVYIDFNGKNNTADLRGYKLRIVPMKKSDIENNFPNITETDQYLASNHIGHSDTYKTAYDNFLTMYSLGVDRNNNSQAVYAGFDEIKDLASPFYNIRAYSGQGQVTFKVSVVDTDGIVNSNQYMIRAFSGTTDVTPDTYRDAVLSTAATQRIVISGRGNNEAITLKVYAVEDFKNNGGKSPIASYTTYFGAATESTQVTAGNFNMKSATESTTGSNGFSSGSIEAVRKVTPGSAFIDFVNPSNVKLATKMHIDISYPGGTTRSIGDYDNPFATASLREVITTNGDDIYRFIGLDDGIFYEAGTYTIAIRLTVDDGNQNVEIVDKLVNFTVV